MQRCCTTNYETAASRLKNENVVLRIRNPQLPIRNFRGDPFRKRDICAYLCETPCLRDSLITGKNLLLLITSDGRM